MLLEKIIKRSDHAIGFRRALRKRKLALEAAPPLHNQVVGLPGLALELVLQQVQRQHHFGCRSLKRVIPAIPAVKDQAAN